jgi:hypothetical protein
VPRLCKGGACGAQRKGSAYLQLSAAALSCSKCAHAHAVQVPRALASAHALRQGLAAHANNTRHTTSSLLDLPISTLPQGADPLLRFFDMSPEYRAHKRRVNQLLVSMLIHLPTVCIKLLVRAKELP